MNRGTELALHLLLRNLERHRAMLPAWVAGEAVGDHPERRKGIRRFLLTDCFPSLLRHIADDPADFSPEALTHAVVCAAHLQVPFGRGGPLDAVVAEVKRRTKGLSLESDLTPASSSARRSEACRHALGGVRRRSGRIRSSACRWTRFAGTSALVTAYGRGLHTTRGATAVGPAPWALPLAQPSPALSAALGPPAWRMRCARR